MLCLTLNLSWGTLYYAFSVLQQAMGREMGWTQDQMMGAFSLSLLITGVSTFGCGFLLRRVSGRRMMAGGSLLAAAALAGVALSQTLGQFYVAWIVVGIATGATLYETAFAVLSSLYDSEHKRAVTAVTLSAGLASTVFWPLTEALVRDVGWRQCVWIYAALQALVCFPLHRWGIPAVKPLAIGHAGGWRAIVWRRPFRYLALCLILNSVVFSALSVHLVPLLTARGLSGAEATWLGALAGPVQVLGRGLEFRLGGHWPIARTGRVALALAITSIALFTIPQAPWGVLAVAVSFFGASNGVMTIVRGVSIRQVFGREQYAAASGALMGPALVCRAMGPLIASLIVTRMQDYLPVLLVLAVLATISWVAYSRGMTIAEA